jgi:hypothetical protein
MPVSYNLRDKCASIDTYIEPQSLGIVQRMLNSGELVALTILGMEENILPSLPITKLKGLHLSNIPCPHLSFLATMPDLQSLSLMFYSSKKYKIDIATLPALENLKTLQLAGIKNLKTLPTFPSLRDLILRETNNESLQFLDRMPLLDDLFISGSNVTDFVQVLNCKNLLRLRLIEMKKLNFDVLLDSNTRNDQLKILDIAHCRLLKDFNFLQSFPNLKLLSVYGCRNIQSFEGLQKCAKLEYFKIGESTVENKDLWPLARINNVALGIRYKRPPVEEFAKIFEGSIYSIGRFGDQKFDHLAFYNKYFRGKLDQPDQIFHRDEGHSHKQY